MYIGIIANLTGEKNKLMERVEKINCTIDLLRELDGPSELSEPDPGEPPEREPLDPPDTKPVTRKYNKRKVTAVRAKKPKHVAGHRGPLKKASQYKGVSLCKKRKNGTQKWRVQFCGNGKIQSLGSYKTELEAAAVYQDHIGDKAEAKRLRSLDSPRSTGSDSRQRKADMAEQRENNPNKPGRSKLKIWICTHCKMDFKHPTRPLRCPNCDSASFKEGQ